MGRGGTTDKSKKGKLPVCGKWKGGGGKGPTFSTIKKLDRKTQKGDAPRMT